MELGKKSSELCANIFNLDENEAEGENNEEQTDATQFDNAGGSHFNSTVGELIEDVRDGSSQNSHLVPLQSN